MIKRPKTFVAIVAHAENLELRKDPGQIPYHAHKVLGYNATLVSYYFTKEKGRAGGPETLPPTDKKVIENDYPFLNSETPGLNMQFLPYRGRGKFYEKAILQYLVKNASKIDVLNLFHFGAETIFYTFIYKIFNPKGKVYVKLDIDIAFYESQPSFFNFIAKLPFLEKLAVKLFLKTITIISAESTRGLDYFKKRFNVPESKLMLMPNGVDDERIKSLVNHVKTYEKKENIILTVGRIGNKQKNNELLMEAISNVDLKDWKVYFVGPIENGFDKIIEKYYLKHPQLVNKVFFTGAANPSKLYEYYNKARVFCMTSKWEGFPLAVCEAIYFGCYPILSNNILSAPEFLEDGRTGQIFDTENINSLTNLLISIIDKTKEIESSYDDIIKLSRNKFTWRNNVNKLISKI